MAIWVVVRHQQTAVNGDIVVGTARRRSDGRKPSASEMASSGRGPKNSCYEPILGDADGHGKVVSVMRSI